MEELFGLLFGGILESLFVGLVLVPIGFCYMYLRYRRGRLVKRVLAKKFEGSYTNAGQVVVLNLAAGILILLVLALIVGAPLAHWLQQMRA